MYFSIKTEDMLKSVQMVFFYLFNNFFKRLISFKRVEYVMKNLLNMFSKDAEYISKYAKYVSKRAEYVKYVSNRAESVSNMIKIS